MQRTTVLVIAGLVSAVIVGWGCSSTPAPGGSGTEASNTSSSSGSSSGGSSSGGSSSGSSSGSSGASSSGSSGTSSSGGSTSSSSGSSGATDAGTDPDLACYSMGSDACETCCENNHPSGSTIYDDAWSNCLCATNTCETVCAQTDCSDSDDAGVSQSGDPCDLCQQQYLPDDGGGACGPPVNTACNGSADCIAYSNCSDNCP
jgi:hypothetical protein